MTPDQYQDATEETEIYTEAANNFVVNAEEYPPTAVKWLSLAYCTGKLNGEAGEVAELVFKALRDGTGEIDDERKEKLFKELGDVQWYIARIAGILGFTLEEVMEANIAKLRDRKNRGVLSGEGSDR